MSKLSRNLETGTFVLDEIHETHGFGNDVDDEFLTFRNTGDEALDLSGWVVENENGQRFVFPDDSPSTPARTSRCTATGGPTPRPMSTGAPRAWSGTATDTITVRTSNGQEVLREPD